MRWLSEGEWAWILTLLGILAYEVWATQTGHDTMSDAIRKITQKHGWFRWVVLGSLLVLAWHLTAWTFKEATRADPPHHTPIHADVPDVRIDEWRADCPRIEERVSVPVSVD